MAAAWPERIDVVDSHTEGEPTRVVVAGWPQPAGATMAERRAFLLASQDHLRQAVVCEPRGHDAVVGALLTPPVEPGSAAGVVFFNNAGALGMCGHGLIEQYGDVFFFFLSPPSFRYVLLHRRSCADSTRCASWTLPDDFAQTVNQRSTGTVR